MSFGKVCSIGKYCVKNMDDFIFQLLLIIVVYNLFYESILVLLLNVRNGMSLLID